MADLNDVQAAQSVKIIGADSSGIESTPVQSTLNGGVHANLRDASGNELIGIKNSVNSISTVAAEDIAYSAGVTNFTIATNATDVFNIIGSATKTVRITRIRVSGSTTSGSPVKVGVQVIKRSTLNTGGTRVATTMAPHDSTSGAATANVGHYTANPTALGTSVGVVRTVHIAFNQNGMTGGDILWDFRHQPVILRGNTQQLCVNFNATSVTGSLISIDVEWTEV